jgi:hypothetical protein
MLEKLRNTRNAQFIKELAKNCSEDSVLFDKLMKMALSDDENFNSRVLWTAGHSVEINNKIFKMKHHKILLDFCKTSSMGGIKRNCMRIWQYAELPEVYVTEIADQAIDFLEKQDEDIAVKAFAITVLQRCLQKIPELKTESLFVVEKLRENRSPAIQVRLHRFINFIEKL